MIKGLIFDLDQTLIDSSKSEQFRNQRNWSKVYELIPQFCMYPGYEDVFDYVQKNGLKTCIVTTSPGKYVERVIKHFNIPIELIVDYFATSLKKPHSEPMIKALEKMGLKNHEALSFGDRAIDIISSNSANIKSVACLWGTNENTLLLSARPTYQIEKPLDIIRLIK